MAEKYYTFITKGDMEGEISPGIFWYDAEYEEWIIEVGGLKAHYQYTQDRCPLDIETRECFNSYTEAWIYAEHKVDEEYDRVIKSWG